MDLVVTHKIDTNLAILIKYLLILCYNPLEIPLSPNWTFFPFLFPNDHIYLVTMQALLNKRMKISKRMPVSTQILGHQIKNVSIWLGLFHFLSRYVPFQVLFTSKFRGLGFLIEIVKVFHFGKETRNSST